MTRFSTRLLLASTAFALVLGFGPGSASFMHAALASTDAGGTEATEAPEAPETTGSHDKAGSSDKSSSHDKSGSGDKGGKSGHR